ncbi:Uncharacterised protein [uncultured archaeon]|nr:Uncharacterised protein [uncultured archaeon]
MEKEKKYYLTCEILPGMFSNERGVEFKDINGNYVSGFWPEKFFKEKENKLEISLREIKGDKALIFGQMTSAVGYGFFQGLGFYVDKNLISSE